MFQKSMFDNHSHISPFCCFVPLHSLSNVWREWSKKVYFFAALAFAFRGSFVLASEPCFLHQERGEGYGRNYRRILNSSSVTCKLKLWRSLQCICIVWIALLFHVAFPIPYVYPTQFHGAILMSGTLLVVIVAFWVKNPRTTCYALHTNNSITLKIFIQILAISHLTGK